MDIINGNKIIALAVTEPSGGSDVSRIKCTAVTDPSDPNYYIVNGEKYFITSGMKADYYTTAVKTGNDPNKSVYAQISAIVVRERRERGEGHSYAWL